MQLSVKFLVHKFVRLITCKLCRSTELRCTYTKYQELLDDARRTKVRLISVSVKLSNKLFHFLLRRRKDVFGRYLRTLTPFNIHFSDC
jgi:hypothetical protein